MLMNFAPKTRICFMRPYTLVCAFRKDEIKHEEDIDHHKETLQELSPQHREPSFEEQQNTGLVNLQKIR